jgi:rhodanese-related sulfurtransferase
MFNAKGRWLLAVCFSLLAVGCFQNTRESNPVPEITKEELRSLLGQPNLIVIDVRIKDEWEKSDAKIKGAVRENPEERIRSWAEKYPRDKTLVFYCD